MQQDKAKWQEKILSLTRDNRKRDLALHTDGKQLLTSEESSLDTSDLTEIVAVLEPQDGRGLIYHQALDLILRSRIEPFQAILTSLMHGAKAQVNGQNIPFSEVITWCQDTTDNDKRVTLAKETRALCRFLAPYSHSSWKALLTILDEEFHYPDYICYGEEKRRVSLSGQAVFAQSFLDETTGTYRKLLEPLLKKTTGISLSKASRFDAIYLLGLRYLDHFFPSKVTLKTIAAFFSTWGEDILRNKALKIHLAGKTGRQSYCIPIKIPGEIHIITGPISGWLDLEALFHELGHAIGLAHTNPALPLEEREFFQSWSLSESFAFLFQKICMSQDFLHEVLGLSQETASLISTVHAIKMLTLARRYAAKLVIEVENFSKNNLQKGEELYAEVMARETGFQYDASTYLFDIMPDFYTLDYFQGFLGSACLWDALSSKLGEKWWSKPGAGDVLRNWWQLGNTMDITSFLDQAGEKGYSSKPFIKSVENIYDVSILQYFK